MPGKALILVNTGTPDSPDEQSVKNYLSEFLNDPMVIDLPWLMRKILVNYIIIPARASKSARLYSMLWTNEGSPLKVNLEKLAREVQQKLGDEYMVTGAMRYGNPSISSALSKIPEGTEITVLPLYPQFANATTGTVMKAFMDEGANRQNVKFIDQFYSHPAFIDVFAEKIRNYKPLEFDHIAFSYHSLPVRQVRNVHPGIRPDRCNCDKHFPEHGSSCYKATCYQTTRLIAEKLKLNEGTYSTTFQSQMSRNWIGPFTSQFIRRQALAGKKRILVAAPSFVSDCLETLIEIKAEYNRQFRASGGKELILVESLNSSREWSDAIIRILKEQA